MKNTLKEVGALAVFFSVMGALMSLPYFATVLIFQCNPGNPACQAGGIPAWPFPLIGWLLVLLLLFVLVGLAHRRVTQITQ